MLRMPSIQPYWNATIDYKYVNKQNDEKLFIELQIDNFKLEENQSEPLFKLRLSRNINIYSNETIYFLNSRDVESTNCLFSGKNRRLSVILIGCDSFKGYLIIQNKIYSIISLNENSSYRIQLLKQHSSKCHTSNSDDLIISSLKQETINLTVNIQKSLVYTLNNNQTKLFYDNFIANSHLLSTYFKAIYDVDIKIEKIRFVDLHTNKYTSLKDVHSAMNQDHKHNRGLNVYILESYSVSSDSSSCYLIKSNDCDFNESNDRILLRYEQSVMRMTNNFIEAILNLIAKDECLVDRFHIVDINLSEHEIEKKKSCLLTDASNCVSKNKCGNGVVDLNEDCDCGKGNCNRLCCDASTCKFLKSDYECSSGDCCHDCKLRKNGHVCRSSQNAECDIEEKCDGISSSCPFNVHVHDGTTCTNGICYSGRCKNADSQCKLIWSKSALSSDVSCYKSFNTIGFQNGNCAMSSSSIYPPKYEACLMDDALCGLLSCQFGGEKPSIQAGSFFKSTTTLNEKQVECKLITNTTEEEFMYVNDGTPCNTNEKMCVNRKCISIPPIKCPISSVNKKLCSGNGICSSELKCVCNEKWTGSACDFYLNNPNYNISQKIDFKASQSSSNINTETLVSIIAIFILIFMFILGFLFHCNRRKRIRAKSMTSIDKIHRLPNSNLNDNLDSSIKFGSLPSYKDFKTKTKSKTSLHSQSNQESTPGKVLNASMQSFGDNISVTKLNHAIKQLNSQPCKSILKTKKLAENQEHYEEIMNALNDTFTNTTLNAQYTTLIKRKSISLTSSSSSTTESSSSSTLSLSTQTISAPTITIDNEIENANIELNNEVTVCLNENIFMDDKQNNFQSKVQEYLNELNRLSKHNNFGEEFEVENSNSLLVTPIKPNIFACESIMNTNTSETSSSGYVSSTTSNNQNNNLNYQNNELLGKTKSNEKMNDSIIYGENETTIIEENGLRRNDKRHSYILATASINNLNIDPE